jgi:hypothetical protein
MQVELFIIFLLLFCFYFNFKVQSIKFEIIVLTALIFFGPKIMFRDLGNYILDIRRDFPSIYTDNLETHLLIAYTLCYSSFYYFCSKFLIHKEYRFALIVLTFGTLAYSQLFLCFAILLFIIQHNVQNKLLRGLIIILSLFSHPSVIVLFSYYLYKYNKIYFLIIFSSIVFYFFLDPFFYLIFSSFDERILIYHSLTDTDLFSKYSFRAHIFMHLLMLIISILQRNIYLVLYVFLVFLFSVSLQNIHAVFVTRFIEILYLLFIILLSIEKYSIKNVRILFVNVLLIFFINNLIKAYLYNPL